MKMDDKLQKWTKKLNNAGRNITEDIIEVVADMKRTVNVLEDIAKQLVKLVNDTNDTKGLRKVHMKKTLIQRNIITIF